MTGIYKNIEPERSTPLLSSHSRSYKKAGPNLDSILNPGRIKKKSGSIFIGPLLRSAKNFQVISNLPELFWLSR